MEIPSFKDYLTETPLWKKGVLVKFDPETMEPETKQYSPIAHKIAARFHKTAEMGMHYIAKNNKDYAVSDAYKSGVEHHSKMHVHHTKEGSK